MKCELCQKHDAETVLYRLTENGKREELYVCHACASRERAFEQQHGIQVAAMDASPMLPPTGMLGGPAHPPIQPVEMPPELSEKLEDFLSKADDFFGQDPDMPPIPEEITSSFKRCPRCGKALGEVRTGGPLGCAQCYEAFREELKEIFSDLQGCSTYQGETPAWVAGKFRIRDLKRQLNDAIVGERFDEAKRLSQELAALQAEADAPTEDDDEN
jgi:protein-arginine kinase activator protein McsA